MTTSFAMGIDVGSLTAKGVLLAGGVPVATHLCRALPKASDSAQAVATALCAQAAVTQAEVSATCLTGYGRFQAPFAAVEKSEIFCHGLGAYHCLGDVRTIIDIGGQDSKAISIDDKGLVQGFAMNNKCAAGTGRALEVLARTLGVEIAALGPLALRGRPNCRISNRCSLFMESDVLAARQAGVDTRSIARAIVEAVAERILVLTATLTVRPGICLTGGVAKNPAVVAALERQLGQKLRPLTFDPQLVGALGAAHVAARGLA